MAKLYKMQFAKLGEQTVIENDPSKFKDYEKLVLPGVGAFGDAMAHLRERNMVDAIREYASSGKYMLGICLGMQLLFLIVVKSLVSMKDWDL